MHAKREMSELNTHTGGGGKMHLFTMITLQNVNDAGIKCDIKCYGCHQKIFFKFIVFPTNKHNSFLYLQHTLVMKKMVKYFFFCEMTDISWFMQGSE